MRCSKLPLWYFCFGPQLSILTLGCQFSHETQTSLPSSLHSDLLEKFHYWPNIPRTCLPASPEAREPRRADCFLWDHLPWMWVMLQPQKAHGCHFTGNEGKSSQFIVYYNKYFRDECFNMPSDFLKLLHPYSLYCSQVYVLWMLVRNNSPTLQNSDEFHQIACKAHLQFTKLQYSF